MNAVVPASRLRASAVIPASLRLERLGKSFGNRNVVSDISLDISAAEVICLLGPSGCGKTTLLRMIAGIEEPTSGELYLDGRMIASASSSLPPEQRGVGLVFQDYALFPQMTVVDNVAFGLRGLSKGEAQAAALNALGRIGLSARANAYPYMLSGGEQQRVALARAIVPRPRVLLMDEPFSNLDHRMRDSVREETISLLRETGATCVMVTHDPEEAMRIADRIALMRDGQLVQIGKPEELYRKPADLDAARFFCDLNEINSRVSAGEASNALGEFAAKDLADGPATVCLRPQAIQLVPLGQGIPARVLSTRFLGEVYMIDLWVSGMEAPLRARVRERPLAKAKQDVAITIDREEVLVFADGRA